MAKTNKVCKIKKVVGIVVGGIAICTTALVAVKKVLPRIKKALPKKTDGVEEEALEMETFESTEDTETEESEITEDMVEKE